MIELLLALIVISMFTPVNYKLFTIHVSDIHNSLITTQIKAMASRDRVMIDPLICPERNCWFNAKGNINIARTHIFTEREKTYELVQWLGFGRFRITERFLTD
jgi:hypothetical protein